MSCRTTRELIEQLQDFHKHLAAFYSRSAKQAKRERVKMLLDYMSHHEDDIAKCLADFEEDAAQKVLDTWFEFLPDIAKCECFESECWQSKFPSDISVDDVVRTALWFDDCLIKFFKQMADLSVSRDVKALFDDLTQMEDQEKRKAMRIALEVSQGV